MGQVLHGSATTTEAVRRAIQHSQESLRAPAKRYGINQKTVAKWKGRTSVADLRTGPKESRSTVLSVEEEAVVVAFRRHTLLERHRSSADKAQTSVDQRPSRENEPHHQGRRRQTLLLRNPPSAANPSARLRRRLQLRQTPQDAPRSPPLRVHLQTMDNRAQTIQTKPAPAIARTEHRNLPGFDRRASPKHWIRRSGFRDWPGHEPAAQAAICFPGPQPGRRSVSRRA
jgi:hypothetical protein